MNEQLISQLQAVVNDKSVVPKVKSGGNAGLATAIVGAIFTGFMTGDWLSGLVAGAAMALPVVINFGVAWIKIDPRMALLKQVLEQMKENGGG